MSQPPLLYFYALRFVQKMKLNGSVLTKTIRLRARVVDTKSIDLARNRPTVSEFGVKIVWKPMGIQGQSLYFWFVSTLPIHAWEIWFFSWNGENAEEKDLLASIS
ncbi:MAG: hypothetical protein ABIP82_05930, partial [Nitrospirales bacterium]